MDLSEHTSLAGIAEAIATVQEVAALLGCEIYVTGALARELWLDFGHRIDTGSETQDVDFGMECADWQTYEKLAEGLKARQLDRDRQRILKDLFVSRGSCRK